MDKRIDGLARPLTIEFQDKTVAGIATNSSTTLRTPSGWPPDGLRSQVNVKGSSIVTASSWIF